MLQKLEFDLAMATGSLHCLKLDPIMRKRVADALVPTKMKVSYLPSSRVNEIPASSVGYLIRDSSRSRSSRDPYTAKEALHPSS